MKAIYSILLFALVILIAACDTGNAQSRSLNIDEYSRKLSAAPQAQLVDVRTPEEYADGHLENSVNIDYNAHDFTDRAAKLDRAKPVFLYCRSGRRSAAAAKELRAMGFAEVYNLKGGILDWEGNGKPVVK